MMHLVFAVHFATAIYTEYVSLSHIHCLEMHTPWDVVVAKTRPHSLHELFSTMTKHIRDPVVSRGCAQGCQLMACM